LLLLLVFRRVREGVRGLGRRGGGRRGEGLGKGEQSIFEHPLPLFLGMVEVPDLPTDGHACGPAQARDLEARPEVVVAQPAAAERDLGLGVEGVDEDDDRPVARDAVGFKAVETEVLLDVALVDLARVPVRARLDTLERHGERREVRVDAVEEPGELDIVRLLEQFEAFLLQGIAGGNPREVRGDGQPADAPFRSGPEGLAFIERAGPELARGFEPGLAETSSSFSGFLPSSSSGRESRM
jgi:hypothetical protein